MKKELLLLSVLIFVFVSAFATHNRGGEITYRHLSGYQYEITITTYTKTSAPADRPTLDSVHYGDGTTGSFTRISKISFPNDVSKNTYKNTHVYPGNGTYRVSFEDPNRDIDVINIPNAVNTPFCIESYIVISALYPVCGNSIEFFDTPVFLAEAHKDYIQNVAVNNPDHDSLTFELVTCLGAGGVPIPGYWAPNTISINKVSGQITWNITNDSVAEYNFAILIKQWWNGHTVGTVTRDYQVELIADVTPNYSFTGPSTLAVDISGDYLLYVNPFDTAKFSLTYFDSFGSNLDVFGEAMLMANKPLVTITNGVDSATASFTWVPDSTYSRPYPYIFTFRGSDTDHRQDRTVLIYVNGKSNYACSATLIGVPEIAPADENEIFIYPNPVNVLITIKGNWGPYQSEISVYNMFGKKVMEEKIESHDQIAVNTGGLSKGIYLLQIVNGDKVFSSKFIKE